MPLFLTNPSAVLLVGVGGKRLLVSSLSSSSSGGSGGSTTPLSVSGIGAYWDASTNANMRGAGGSPVAAWNASVSSIADTSGNSVPLAAYSFSSGSPLPQSTPRVNGLLGACGLSSVSAVNAPATLSTGQYLPFMGADQGWQAAGVTLGGSADWTVYLVWSRPNWRQAANAGQPVTLVKVGSVPVVQLTAADLTLFPTGANTSLTTTMPRRHSYALVLSYAHSANQLTAYVNGATSGTAVTANLGNGGPLTLLHDMTNGGGAQCWFHEAAYWPRAMESGDVATLNTAMARWTLGARKGATIAVVGQSNAVNGYAAGAWHLLAQGVAWYLGALAWNVAAADGLTLVGGVGIYPVPSGDPGYGFAGTFLINPGDGSDPMTAPWALDTSSGAIGEGCDTYFSGLSAADLGDVVAVWWPWSETDSTRLYSEKTTLNEAQQRAIQLVRGFIGQSASVLPLVTWNAMPFPYGNDAGEQAMRESEYDLTQLSGSNVVIGLTNACDVNPLGTTIGVDGLISGGDYFHINTPDLPKLGMRAAALTARAVLASSGGDTISSFPSGVISAGGPRITHVYQQSGTEYVLTITHDAGTALIVPQQAVNGVGFAIMDGGSLSTTPGPIILANACSVIDATHLLVTMASAPTHTAASCLFYYPYGAVGGVGPGGGVSGSGIGSGNAVTDNASSITAPTGWDIGNQLLGTGSVSWAMNYPLAATTYGLAVSTSPT